MTPLSLTHPTPSLPETPALPLFTKLNSNPFNNDWVLRIDNSSLSLFMSCPCQALFGLVYKRIAAGERLALTYGTAIHKALELHYLGEKDPLVIQGAIEQCFEGTRNDFNDWRTPERAFDTYMRYVKFWEGEPWHVIEHEGKKMVECAFSLPLGKLNVYQLVSGSEEYIKALFGEQETAYVKIDNLHILWTGRLDLLIRENTDTWVMDHKTASQVGESYFKEYELAQPSVGYVWAARQAGFPAVGLMLNVIIGRAITKTGTPTAFERRRFPYPTHRIDEFQTNAMTIVSQFVGNIVSGDFPRFTNQCVGRYGVCQYHDVCLAPEAQRLSYLNSPSFKANTWSPLT